MRNAVRMLGPFSATVLDYEPRAQLPRHHHAPATRWADSLTRYLPKARHLVFPTGSHVPFGTPCAAGLVTRFILAGDAGGLDFSCAATLTRPPFRLP